MDFRSLLMNLKRNKKALVCTLSEKGQIYSAGCHFRPQNIFNLQSVQPKFWKVVEGRAAAGEMEVEISWVNGGKGLESPQGFPTLS